MAISDFQNFGFLIPKNQNFDFSKINAQNFQNFIDIQKRIHVIELCVTNRCTKFQANIFIFGCAMAQKPGEGDDVTFLNRIFGICNCRTSKQMTFSEFRDKTGQDRYVLKRHFWFSKFDLFDLNLP